LRLVTFKSAEKQSLGALIGDVIYDLKAASAIYGQDHATEKRSILSDMPTFLAGGTAAKEHAMTVLAWAQEGNLGAHIAGVRLAYPLAEVCLLPPIPRPGKIICLAGNYQAHVTETGQVARVKEKATPWMFMKPSTSLCGPDYPVYIPRLSDTVDWEVELAVVIGAPGRYITAAKAWNYVGGYTIFNDVSARSLKVPPSREERPRDRFQDWLHGKWFDTFGCMGPTLVLKDEVPDPHNLDFELRVNGEVRQSSNTSQMTFTIPEIIEFASAIMTLEPGDVIPTGTIAGIGSASTTYLQPGDVMEAEIERLGILRNPVSAEPRTWE
jgi:2-keto-4-pentenoate hydratase/2-oxohepta-3-ene-1,7-dioic acid hydratase in catechol pathway